MDPTLMQVLKIGIAACLIALASWLSGPDRNPWLAGFIIALPLTSMLALAFSAVEHQDAEASINFAKSILIAVPLSLLFFVPFLFADKLKFGFWGLYGSGVALLFVAWVIHDHVIRPAFADSLIEQAADAPTAETPAPTGPDND